MSKAESEIVSELRNRAGLSLTRLRGLSQEDIEAIRSDVVALRDARQFDLMAKLAEALSRRYPNDPENRKLYAQCMIETGYCTVAIDVMNVLAERLSPSDTQWAEAHGLVGRAYKRIFHEANDKAAVEARDALKQAISAYNLPWKYSKKNTWHGVNLIALTHCAERLGIETPVQLDTRATARDVIRTLTKTPACERGLWYHPTLAEAYLALDDLSAVERQIRRFASGPNVNAFAVASTLRQFTEVWNLENKGDRERSIVEALRACLLDIDGHALRVDPRDVSGIRKFSASTETLEAVLGAHGAETYRSMQLGMRRAVSVASIWLDKPNNQIRWGTGFLLRAGDFGCFGKKDINAEERIVLTNWHVVNEHGLYPGIRPEDTLVKFEASSPPTSHRVAEIIWTRGVERHDAAFLRLVGEAPVVEPLALAKHLPAVHEKARVFIIGYPGGRELALSLQDNKLVSHEGPPDGKPVVRGVERVHYRTPTERGSSGSPVFDADGEWQVVALHHAGPPPGTNIADAVNEGISIGSIMEAVLADFRRTGDRGSTKTSRRVHSNQKTQRRL